MMDEGCWAQEALPFWGARPKCLPRRRQTEDPGRLSDAELLAIVVGGSAARESEAAYLLETVGGLREVAGLSGPELSRMPGIGPNKAARLQAAVELGRRLATRQGERTVIRHASDAAKLLMERMRYLEQEHFQTIVLNTKHRVLAVELVGVGGLAMVHVHPREVFKGPIRRSAASVILAHNHPSGDPTPSPEDVELTRRLGQAGRILGIEVLDHLVIGDNRYVSLREQGVEWGF